MGEIIVSLEITETMTYSYLVNMIIFRPNKEYGRI